MQTLNEKETKKSLFLADILSIILVDRIGVYKKNDVNKE